MGGKRGEGSVWEGGREGRGVREVCGRGEGGREGRHYTRASCGRLYISVGQCGNMQDVVST